MAKLPRLLKWLHPSKHGDNVGDASIQFYLGGPGTGAPFHRHDGAYNALIYGQKRWFLYLHLMDVHEYTYDESSALFGGSYSDIYDNSIRWTDSVLGIFWEYLVDMGLDDDTVVAIGSDHGEAFRERGLEGHARFVYRETTEVPLILAFPFRLPEGVVVETRSRNVDIMPTLLDLAGVAAPDSLDGRSLVPDILAAGRGEAAPDVDRTGVAHLDQTWGQRGQSSKHTVAVTDGSLRYVRIEHPAGAREELFDGDADARELTDVAEERSEEVSRLRARADGYLAEEPKWGEAPSRDVDELELNQLRALGYAIP